MPWSHHSATSHPLGTDPQESAQLMKEPTSSTSYWSQGTASSPTDETIRNQGRLITPNWYWMSLTAAIADTNAARANFTKTFMVYVKMLAQTKHPLPKYSAAELLGTVWSFTSHVAIRLYYSRPTAPTLSHPIFYDVGNKQIIGQLPALLIKSTFVQGLGVMCMCTHDFEEYLLVFVCYLLNYLVI